jgi:CRP-like cAMP-binding protein
MAPKNPSNIFRNRLLSSLSSDDLERLTPRLSFVDLAVRQDMEQPHRPIKHVYFPEAGVASIVGRGPRHKNIEIGIIGREGMTGLMIVLGNDRSPYHTYCQMAGSAHRITADDLRKAMEESPTLRLKLLRFVQAFMILTAHTAIINGSAKLEERLARWLLMAHDRTDGDSLPLKHDFMALMLGVRRAGVTVTLHALGERGLIEGKRAIIKVIDREGLEEIAGASYGTPEAEYERRMSEG